MAATSTPDSLDPYSSSRFRVKWDGVFIPNVTKISGLARVTDVIVRRDGSTPGNMMRQPGQTQYQPLVISRDLTNDHSFETWANEVFAYSSQSTSSTATDYRKDITIEIYNDSNQLVLSYNCFRCWPSGYQAVASLDSSTDVIGVEVLTVETEGWTRDINVVPPMAPAPSTTSTTTSGTTGPTTTGTTTTSSSTTIIPITSLPTLGSTVTTSTPEQPVIPPTTTS